MMLGMCKFLAATLNTCIILLAGIELFFAVIAGLKLFKLKRRVISINSIQIRHLGKPKRTGKARVTTTAEVVKDMNYHQDMDIVKEEYQNTESWYTAFSLVIQLFPLLGILGTVAGLYQAMNEQTDMYTGVGFALSSTVIGIIWAIIYKIVDIIFTARAINYIDEGLDIYEKNYHVDREEAASAQNEERKRQDIVNEVAWTDDER